MLFGLFFKNTKDFTHFILAIKNNKDILQIIRLKNILKLSLLSLSFISIIVSIPISDLNFNFIRNKNNTEGQYKLVSWNTLFWEQNPSEMFEIIRAQDADVIHFQEYIIKEDYSDFFIKRDPDQIELVKKAFPEYEIAHEGELLTLSKFPIINVKRFEGVTFLRIDVAIDSEIVSFYNVHIPVHIDLRLIDDLTDFLMDIRLRSSVRIHEFNTLAEDIKNNKNKIIISGDFNSTKTMGTMNKLLGYTQDAIRRSDLFIPTTWSANKTFNLWRIDYVLDNLGNNLKTYTHSFIHDISDHAMMEVTFDI
ncbi:MAG: hypothetical protein Kow0081_0260 [Candidatus Dojkabacteria bacterium]